MSTAARTVRTRASPIIAAAIGTALNASGRLRRRNTGINGETDPGRCIVSRTAALRERLTFVADRAGRGELDGVEIEDGKLYIARTPPSVPEAARDRPSG
jgi:hypothetical protein